MNRVRVLFFATLRDRAGRRSAEIELPDEATVHSLKEQLAMAFPELRPTLSSVLVAINREYAAEEAPIPEAAEVALFPPVSGG